MKSMYTRLLCAMLSTAGAAGLVAFADPANAVGAAPTRHCVILAAAATPVSIDHRG